MDSKATLAEEWAIKLDGVFYMAKVVSFLYLFCLYYVSNHVTNMIAGVIGNLEEHMRTVFY